MQNRQAVLDALQSMGIPYVLHEHPPVHTIEDCLLVPGIDWAETAQGANSKISRHEGILPKIPSITIPRNAFVCNRQRTAFYLMLLRHDVPFRTAIVSKALGVSRLSFAPEDALPGLLGLTAGAVSPLGLLFDTERRVSLVLDNGLRQYESLAFHPCDNTATVVLRAADFTGVFLSGLHRTPTWVDPLQEVAT